MIIEAVQFGHIEIEEDQIFIFKQGIPGFTKYTRFAVIEVEDTPFSYLQSTEEGKLAFLLVDPFSFHPKYEFDLPLSAAEELQVDSLEQVMVRSIVTVKENLETATMNLVAPIVINTDMKTGKQVILPSTNYTTKHPLVNKGNNI